jgi:hypothetical protein
MCERSNADRCGRSREKDQQLFARATGQRHYLGVLCIHERLSKAEKDDVGVCHETVSSYSCRVNLNKKSDRATNRAY